MKLQILFCALTVLSSLCAYVHAVPAHCTVAGDPHFKTFDGVIYDHQATGDFVLAKNPKIEVQARFQRCTETLSCVRRTAVSLFALNPSMTITWGSFPARPAYAAVNGTYSFPATAATPAVTDNVMIYSFNILSRSGCTWDSVNFALVCPLSAFNTPMTVGTNEQYRIQAVGNKALYITQFAGPGLDGSIGARVVIGNLTTIVTMPDALNYVQQTKGLCGFYDNDPSVELVNVNNTVVVLDTRANEVYNTPDTPIFANTWKVTGADSTLATNKHSLSSVEEKMPQGVFAPTVKPKFATQEAEAKAEAACRGMPLGEQKHVYEHCMYDHAVMGNDPLAYDLAYSNSFAAQVIAETEQEYQRGVDAVAVEASAEQSGASNQNVIALIGAGGVFTVLAAIVVIRARARRTQAVSA